MANGKTAQSTVGEVKSICNTLEVSPSQRSETSPIYGTGGHTVVQPTVSGGKTHAGKRGTPETPEKLMPAHNKRGH